jgi:hypothetical protein
MLLRHLRSTMPEELTAMCKQEYIQMNPYFFTCKFTWYMSKTKHHWQTYLVARE